MNEQIKKIDRDALRELCLEYDLEYKNYPESEFEGEAIYAFYLEKIGVRLEERACPIKELDELRYKYH